MINLPNNFYMEGGFVAVLIVYGLLYFAGKRANEGIVRSWANSFRSSFDEQFARLGSEGSLLIKESQSSFRMQCAGRANCAGAQVNVRLRKRHDLVSRIWEFFSPVEDLVDVTVVANDNMPPLVLAVAPNSQARALKSAHKDIDAIGKSVNVAGLDSARWTVVCDSKELATTLITEDIAKLLEKHRSLFRYLHFTDQYTESKDYKKVMRFRFRMPSAAELTDPETLDSARLLFKIAFYMVDAVAEKVHLNAAAIEKAKKARSKFVTEEQKEKQQELEDAQEAKRAEKRKQLQERMKSMSAEEREKLERKLEMKDLKKRQQKVKMMRG